MVLPGIQALFGFQLIAVFRQEFGDTLSIGEQRLHVVAIALSVVAIAIIMDAGGIAPADRPAGSKRDLHPRVQPSAVVEYVAVGRQYLHRRLFDRAAYAGALVAAALLGILVVLWFVVPHVQAFLAGSMNRARDGGR
jgi:hypothetical protein